MRTSIMLGIAAATIIPVSLLIYASMETAGERAGAFISDRGLEDTAGHIRRADEELDRLVRQKMNSEDAELEGEIDFLNPTEQDVRFLLTLLRGGTEPQKRSAANAMVAIGDPRFVRHLLSVSIQTTEPGYYCSGALELLRHQTKAGATEWLLAATGDESVVLDESCTAQIESKMALIGSDTSKVLVELLYSEWPHVLKHALDGLKPGEVGPADIAQISVLSKHRDDAVAAAAQRWLSSAEAIVPTAEAEENLEPR